VTQPPEPQAMTLPPITSDVADAILEYGVAIRRVERGVFDDTRKSKPIAPAREALVIAIRRWGQALIASEAIKDSGANLQQAATQEVRSLPQERVTPEVRGETIATLRDIVRTYESGRCFFCYWPLAATRERGCVPGNCAFRPEEHSEEYRRKRSRVEQHDAALSGLPLVSVSPSEEAGCVCNAGFGMNLSCPQHGVKP